MTEFTRADVLAAFGVTEQDLAAIDHGHQAARAEADAQTDHFRGQIPARAELAFTIGRSHREEDGTLVIDEIAEMHWSAWC